MGLEIERKFLVKNNITFSSPGTLYKQGYLNLDIHRIVRVRLINQTAYLTVKGIRSGATRLEFEYEIPNTDAEIMLRKLCQKPLIEKFRHKIEHKGMIWEVDQFIGQNEGLIIAEIELQREEQPFEKPGWLGDEVTEDLRYTNSYLVKHPYKSWTDDLSS